MKYIFLGGSLNRKRINVRDPKLSRYMNRVKEKINVVDMACESSKVGPSPEVEVYYKEEFSTERRHFYFFVKDGVSLEEAVETLFYKSELIGDCDE